jgi:kynurenine formamidase
MTADRADRADFAGSRGAGHARWEPAEVTSPHLDRPVPVIAAKDIPYIPNNNRLQNVSIYLPRTSRTAELIGAPVRSLPGADSPPGLPRYLVHVHGGAWRDPRLTSAQAHRLTGTHAAPWEQGIMICQSLLDTLRLWREER